MSYLVLARKYRPQVFEEIVGQEGVGRTLAGAISSGRVAHAYLFCGPRGVGKTTAARILAKALNCEKGPTPVPCNVCRQCREIIEGRSLDVLEIDGASTRGIDDVRELRESARYAPASGRNKIYIIDEVHMLTKEAFNALLKTLEEPPPHVVFVLATTEAYKLPATILSRCQRFDFSRIPTRVIAAHLQKLTAAESIEAAPEALAVIARRARGGLRDALSLLDQIIPAVEGVLTQEKVEGILGLVGSGATYALVDRLAEEDTAGALELLDTLYARGTDLEELAESLTLHLRDLLFLRTEPRLAELLEAPASEVPELSRQAARFERDVLADLLDRAAQTKAALRYSDHPRLAVELALAEMAQAARQVPLAEIARRLLALEAKMGGAPTVPVPPAKRAKRPDAPAPEARTPETRTPEARTQEPLTPSPSPAAKGSAAEAWELCLPALKEASIRLWGTLHTAEAVGFAPDGSLVLRLPGASGFVAQSLKEPKAVEMLRQALAVAGSGAPRVVLEGEDVVTAPAAPAAPTVPAVLAAAPAAAPPEPEPEAKPEPKPKPAADDRSMGQLFKDEPMLQKALDMFDGEVLP